MKLINYIILLFISLAILACTSDTEAYRAKLTDLRESVRSNFSPKFDPIWIAREKKAAKAKKELNRLMAVMDNALNELSSFDPPEELLTLHSKYHNLFRDCKKALGQILTEADQESPKGMKAVHIYQEMTRKFLEMEADS